jgi:hypothetical protein
LSSREEDDSTKSGAHSAAEGTDSSPCDLSTGGFSSSPLGSGGDHVRLEEASFNDEVMGEHLSHGFGEDTLGDGGAGLHGVGSVNHNLGFDNGYESVVLADTTIAGKSMSGLVHGELRGSTILNRDLEDSSPFGEAASLLIEGLAAAGESIETLSSIFVHSSSHNDNTLVDLDSSKDSTAVEELDKVSAISSSLGEGVLEHNDSRNALLDLRGSEEKFSVGSGIFGSVFNSDSFESLSDGTGRLIGSKDSLTSHSDLLGVLDKLGFESVSGVSADHSVCWVN